MKTLNPSNHNVANTFGDQSNIVTFNTTIYSDTTALRRQLEEQSALNEKQKLYIEVLVKILKEVWIKKM